MRLPRAVWMLCMVTGAQASVGSADWAFEGHCTGAFSQRWGDVVAMDCAGDLSLTGLAPNARLEAADAITLRADGRLSLSDLTLVAPHIVLDGLEVVLNGGLVSPGGTIDVFANRAPSQRPPMGSGPTAPGGSIVITPGAMIHVAGHEGRPSVSAGGRLQMLSGSLTLTTEPTEGFLSLSPSLSPVPEPGAWALALSGLLTVGLCRVPPRPRG